MDCSGLRKHGVRSAFFKCFFVWQVALSVWIWTVTVLSSLDHPGMEVSESRCPPKLKACCSTSAFAGWLLEIGFVQKWGPLTWEASQTPPTCKGKADGFGKNMENPYWGQERVSHRISIWSCHELSACSAEEGRVLHTHRGLLHGQAHRQHRGSRHRNLAIVQDSYNNCVYCLTTENRPRGWSRIISYYITIYICIYI